MLNSLTQKITDVFSHLGTKKLTSSNIEDAIRKIRLALIEADVNILAIKKFISTIKEKSLGEHVIKSVSSTDMFIKIVHDTLVNFLGEEQGELNLKEPTQMSYILVSGLQGAGKTTTVAKLAYKLKKKRDILLVSLDIYRPAAAEQLQILAQKCGVDYFKRGEEKNVTKIIKSAKNYAKKNIKNLIIFDTAGRTQLDEEMLSELKVIYKQISPVENILVCDSMIGQNALTIAEKFKNTVPLNSLIFTKFDSDTRGGAVLSVKQVLDVPVKYIGIGEKIDELDEFVPSRITERILGMGDVVGLVNKVQDNIDLKESENLTEKIKNNKFDFKDFLTQLNLMNKMGSLKSLLGMMPGLGNKNTNIDIDEKQFVHMKAVIQSMTINEQKNPFMVYNNNGRKSRIARGSGTTILFVNKFLKQFQSMKVMMKKMNNPFKMKSMMQKMMGSNMNNSQFGEFAKALEEK